MLTYLQITKDILIVLLYLSHCPLCQLAIPENIHTPPMDDTELGTKKFQGFHEGQYNSTVCRNPKPADSKS